MKRQTGGLNLVATVLSEPPKGSILSSLSGRRRPRWIVRAQRLGLPFSSSRGRRSEDHEATGACGGARAESHARQHRGSRVFKQPGVMRDGSVFA